ncbi:MAG: M55 family metallopeptidase, partial [Candidatus Omnitrophica bacterium]|nr:M55 family metallopeptidase [Candidatus Omnitrophota bacterium]
MKYFILTDLEGTSGVYKWSQVGGESANSEEYKLAKIWMTKEVNASIEGILEKDKDAEIIVWDGHGPGGIEIEHLHPEAKLIPRGDIRCPYTLDQGYDAVIMIAQHSMAGTPKGNLCHTYSSRFIYRYWLNGREIGEIGLRAFVAGYFNIPVILVTGDDATCKEAESFIPEVETVCVKKAIHHQLAITLHPEKARKLIKEGTKRAIEKIGKIKPIKINPPYVFKAQFLNSTTTYHFTHSYSNIKKIDEYTIEIKGDDLLETVKIFA